MTSTDRAVVAVIGGGPAGASAALELARCGIGTRLLERSDGSGSPVGECLAPSANPLLHRLGLDEVMLTSGALPSYGNRSSWGGDGTPADRDFLREALGHGWHLDRPAFNGALLDAVEAVGVPVWRQTRMTALTHARHTWEIGTVSSGGARTLSASMLVDASGRAAVVARRQAVRRRAFDSQIAAVTILEGDGRPAPLQDATTVIEAAACGWWYAALLPDRRLAVAWFTDPDLLSRSGAWRPPGWWDLLRRSNHVWNVVASHGYGMPRRIRVVAAGSSLLNRATGDGWIATGDAAAAFDPLSSHGIGSALASGMSAAKAVAATLAGDATAWAAYDERLRSGYAHYLWARHAYYADERRWPQSHFWARRQAGAHPPPEKGT
jgi:flavin-dependent dehydrogenase